MLKSTISTKKIKNIKTKEAIKLLGIIFTDDLKATSTINWNNCIQKTEKQIQELSRKHLPLRGKATFKYIDPIQSETSIQFPVSETLKHTYSNTYDNFLTNNLLQGDPVPSEKPRRNRPNLY